MDKMSKTLDEEYQEIESLEKKIMVKEHLLETLKSGRLDGDFMKEQIEVRMDEIVKMETELAQMKLSQADDFMHVRKPRVLEVLRLRYMDRLPWPEIQKKLDISLRRAYELRDQGLKEIAAGKAGLHKTAKNREKSQ